MLTPEKACILRTNVKCLEHEPRIVRNVGFEDRCVLRHPTAMHASDTMHILAVYIKKTK